MKQLVLPIVIFLVFTCSIMNTYGQSTPDIIVEFNSTLTGQISVQAGQYQLVTDFIEQDSTRRVGLESVRIEAGDLLIRYTVEPLSSLEKDMQYLPDLHVAFNNGQMISAYREMLTGFHPITVEFDQEVYEVTWEDFTVIDEFQLGDFKLLLSVDLMGLPLFDCNEPRPTFLPEQKRPYWITGAAAIGLIGTGTILKISSGNRHRQYENEVYAQESESLFEATYSQANQSSKTGVGMMVIGSAILIGDGLLFLIRKNKLRKRGEAYDDYCNKAAFQLRPMLELNSQQSSNAGVLAHFSLKF